MRNVVSGMLKLKNGFSMRKLKCLIGKMIFGMWNAKRGIQNVKFRIWNPECRLLIVEIVSEIWNNESTM